MASAKKSAVLTTPFRGRPECAARELLLDQVVQLLGDRRMIEALDGFVKETAPEKMLRDWFQNAPREQVEELVLVQLARSGAAASSLYEEVREASTSIVFHRYFSSSSISFRYVSMSLRLTSGRAF